MNTDSDRLAKPQPTRVECGAPASRASSSSGIPDYPAPGIIFRDIMPLLADGPALRATVDALIAPFLGTFDVIAGLEARGFLLGERRGVLDGGRAPADPQGWQASQARQLRSATSSSTASPRSRRTTMFPPAAACCSSTTCSQPAARSRPARELLELLGYTVSGTAVLFEIDGMGGRAVVADPHLHTVFTSGE